MFLQRLPKCTRALRLKPRPFREVQWSEFWHLRSTCGSVVGMVAPLQECEWAPERIAANLCYRQSETFEGLITTATMLHQPQHSRRCWLAQLWSLSLPGKAMWLRLELKCCLCNTYMGLMSYGTTHTKTHTLQINGTTSGWLICCLCANNS